MRRVAAALALACAGATAQAAAPACEVEWTLRARLDAPERHFEATLSFDGGRRTRTPVRLPAPWAGVDDYATHLRDLRPAARSQRLAEGDEPLLRDVLHQPGERVTLRWRVTSPVFDPDSARARTHEDLYRTLLGRDWFQFFGKGVLPRPQPMDDGRRLSWCIVFTGLPPGAVLAGSHGVSRGPRHVVRRRGTLDEATEAVYLGGRLVLQERSVEGRPVVTATPARAAKAFGFTPERFADAVAQVIGAHRRFWGEFDVPHLIVVLQPNHQPVRRGGGTAVRQAFVMHASPDFSVPGPTFDFLVGHEHLHTWIPGRFGPMQRDDAGPEILRYWFSEGFTNFYTHRLLVNAGLWSLEDHARRLSEVAQRYLASPVRAAPNAQVAAEFFDRREVMDLPYQRGEFLALRWHAMLRAIGHPGLDAVMKSLLQPAAAAGPRTALATDRLLAALRPLLGDRVDDDVERWVRLGEPFPVDDRLAGPCFERAPGAAMAWRVRGGGLAEADCAAWFGF
jgi:M61 glycyl aminopeptidase